VRDGGLVDPGGTAKMWLTLGDVHEGALHRVSSVISAAPGEAAAV